MSGRKIPPISLLRAFEETCRFLSFRKSAEALFMTQSAVSRQVRQLEEFLGKQLFIRRHSGLELTPDAVLLLPVVRQSLDILEDGLSTIQLVNPLQHLRLQVAPTFATRWLAPRLVRLKQQSPRLHIAMISEHQQKYSDFDCAIRFGDAPTLAEQCQLLAYEQLCAVISPLLLEEGRLPTLSSLPLLHILDGSHRLNNWARWLQTLGISKPSGVTEMEFSTQDQVINACVTGAGAAVVDTMMISHELQQQLLIPLHSLTLKGTNGYWLDIPGNKRCLPRVRHFQQWLIEEIEQHPPAIKTAPTVSSAIACPVQ